MSTNYYYPEVNNKIYHFVRTDSGRFFDVTDCHPVTDKHIDDNNGLLLNAKQVSAQYVADMMASTFRSNEDKEIRKASIKTQRQRYYHAVERSQKGRQIDQLRNEDRT